MTAEDEEVIRQLTGQLAAVIVTVENAAFLTNIAMTIELARFLDALVSDLKEDSTAYQLGRDEARRELLVILSQQNHHFGLIRNPTPDQFRERVAIHVRPARPNTELPPTSARQDALPQQQDMFGDTTLPEICMALRMGVNGSADSWSPADIGATVRMLRYRLQAWQTGVPRDAEVDDCVRRLVEATCEEVMRYEWWQG